MLDGLQEMDARPTGPERSLFVLKPVRWRGPGALGGVTRKDDIGTLVLFRLRMALASR